MRPFPQAWLRIIRLTALILVLLCAGRAWSQGLPSVQQNQFRAQWVGESVDQIPFQNTATPLNGLGAIVGSLQTPDQVQAEVEASLANVKVKSPIVFKPSLGLGWEISNQGIVHSNNVVSGSAANRSVTTNSVATYSQGSSSFAAPALSVLYDREHGPWTVSAGYSIGYKYFTDPNFVANGTGTERNPLAQTALFKTSLEMSRYILNTLLTASSGTGYDISSGSNNRQTTVGVGGDAKYMLSSAAALAAELGYNYQNSSGSTATPNNNVTSYFGDVDPIYDLSDKTHLSGILGFGSSSQSLQSGTQSAGNAAISTPQNTSRNYVQALGKVKYELTGKLVFDVGLGARYVANTGITNSIDSGLQPAWAVGLGYTPTAKTSFSLSAGVQGADVQPGVNFAFNWNPREKTRFTLTASQSQNFANTLSSQYLVSTSILGTVSQKLFSNVELQLSGGYTQQKFVNLSSTSTNQSTSQLPSSFFIAQGALIWKIRDWVNLSNTLYINTGQNQTGGNSSSLSQSQMWDSISLNFEL